MGVKIQEVTLRYYGSKKPPTVLIELPIHVAEMLTDGHENITVNLFDDIRKAIEHAKSDKHNAVINCGCKLEVKNGGLNSVNFITLL